MRSQEEVQVFVHHTVLFIRKFSSKLRVHSLLAGIEIFGAPPRICTGPLISQGMRSGKLASLAN